MSHLPIKHTTPPHSANFFISKLLFFAFRSSGVGRNISSGVRKKRMMWYGDTNGQTIVKISGAMLQNCQIARDKKNALLSGKTLEIHSAAIAISMCMSNS